MSKQKINTGYKILEYNQAQQTWKTILHRVNGTKSLPTDTWLKAECKQVKEGAKGKLYKSGFHVLPTYQDCARYAVKFKKLEDRYIVRIKYRGNRKKKHSPSPVILADYMFIPNDAYNYSLVSVSDSPRYVQPVINTI